MSTSEGLSHMDGKIEACGDYLHWTLSKPPKQTVFSPYFNFAGRIWAMYVGASKTWLFLILKNFSEGKASDLVKLGLKVDDKYILRSTEPDETGRIFTVPKVILLEELRSSNKQLLPDGILTVVCKIDVQVQNEPNPRHHVKEKSISKLQKDYQKLLDSGHRSNVSLRVGNREFRAHRNILSARSRVFKTMFSHRMKEKITGVVVIKESDPDVFSDFLHYLYTGSAERITFENAQELYVIADRYQVSELQTQCVYLIEKNLADENVGEFVNLGLRHNDRELVDAVTRFLSKRAEALTRSFE